jgi:hypothetical protein
MSNRICSVSGFSLYPRTDAALFGLASLLTQVGKQEQARNWLETCRGHAMAFKLRIGDSR